MRILAMVNAHALAHVSRALEVAKPLRDRGHWIAFSGQGQYLNKAADAGFETLELPYTPIEQVVEAVRTERFRDLFPKEQLAQYVEAELALYRRLAPDLLLVDNRITASTSAEIYGVAQVNIVNVHLTRYKTIPFLSAADALGLRPSWVARSLDRLVNGVESVLYDKIMMGGMGCLRQELRLPRKHGHTLEHGDLTLFPDVPEFNPAAKLPRNAHYIGPLTWQSALPPPRCLSQLDPDKACIYFTIGSAGFTELVQQMSVFADEPVQVVVATGMDAELSADALPDNVFIESFVNADALLPHCDLVVCHGGNGTIYQALSHGLPIVGVATHAEQLFGLRRVNQLSLGRGFKAEDLQQVGLRLVAKAVQSVLRDSTYRHNARRFQHLLRAYAAPQRAVSLIESFARSTMMTRMRCRPAGRATVQPFKPSSRTGFRSSRSEVCFRDEPVEV